MSKFVKLFLSLLGLGADVVTVTSGTAGTAGSTAAELITYMASKMLEVAELNTIMDQFGSKEPLPSNSSLTIRFTREEKFSVASTPTQLTQGIAPDAAGLTINQIEATVEQYGFVVRMSDLAELTARHNLVAKTIYLLGLHAAETYDVLIYNVLKNATNTYYPNARAGDTSLFATDYVQYTDLVELDSLLNDKGARPMEGGEYVFVCASQVYATLLRDPDWKASQQFQAPERIWRGEVGSLGGFRVVRSNAPSFATPDTQTTSGQTNKIFTGFAIARYAYSITDLQNLRVYVVAPGGQTDPLQQSRKVGWKFCFKALIQNQDWIRRVRSSGLVSANN